MTLLQRLRPTLFCETVVDMEAETLVNTIHYSLRKVEAETLVDTLSDMDPKASAKTLAKRVAEGKADKDGETQMHVIVASPV